MEREVRKKGRPASNRLTRYLAIGLLLPLLIFFVTRSDDLNRWLLDLKWVGEIISLPRWALIVKFLSYCLHILLNFCLLLAITNRLRYSLSMVYVAVSVLFVGMFLVGLRDLGGINVSLTLIALFVKIDKSLLLLVLFVAGHILSNRLRE